MDEKWILPDPDEVKHFLILSSMYLAAYELLLSSVVDGIRDFYYVDIKDDDNPLPDAYKTDVLKGGNSVLKNSLAWLIDCGALSQEDAAAIDEIRVYRNKIAHELPRILLEAHASLDIAKFLQIRGLLVKLERWWIMNVHVAANAVYDNVEVREDEVASGSMLVLDYMIKAGFQDFMIQP